MCAGRKSVSSQHITMQRYSQQLSTTPITKCRKILLPTTPCLLPPYQKILLPYLASADVRQAYKEGGGAGKHNSSRNQLRVGGRERERIKRQCDAGRSPPLPA